MASVKLSIAASTAITITAAATLATGAMAQSLAIDNTGNLYIGADVTVKATLAAGAPATSAYVGVYVAFLQNGSDWDDNANGTDSAIVLRVPTGLTQIGSLPTPTANGITWVKTFNVDAPRGGRLPLKWSLIIDNETGFAFTAFSATYSGIFYTVA